MLIHKYHSNWVTDFNRIKTVIIKAFQELDIQIEHIGSTAVPHLAAKPIIDIDIIYDEKITFNNIKKGLATLNYYHNGNQGIENREVFKRDKSKQKHPTLDFVMHHLYVCPRNSKELKRHLLFRNYLREHSKERIIYETLKYQIAEQTNQDRKAYAKLKEIMAKTFIEEILEKASSFYSV